VVKNPSANAGDRREVDSPDTGAQSLSRWTTREALTLIYIFFPVIKNILKALD